MPKATTLTVHQPEVMPAENTLPAKVVADAHVKRVGLLHQAASTLSNGAIMCAAIAGAVMIQKKNSLGHGRGFTAWKESLAESIGLASRTADNYIALADKMSERIDLLIAQDPHSKLSRKLLKGANSHHDANLPPATPNALEMLAALKPADVNAIMKMPIAEAVRAVAPEDSLRQLYFAWGIVKEPKLKGGARTAGDAPKLTPEERVECARSYWLGTITDLEDCEISSKDPNWGHLPKEERIRVVRFLQDLATHIAKSIHKGD